MNIAYEEFSRKHPGQLVVRGDMHLVPLEHCLDFVGLCEKHSLRILGIEGFWFSGQAIVPCEKYIADFSAASQSETATTAKGFFCTVVDHEVLFEFVLSEEK
jgi:hypothetical protein